MGQYYRFAYSCDSESDLPNILALARTGELAYCISEDSVWRKIGGNWTSVSAVSGPGSSTDGNIALYNGTSGGVVKNSAYSPSSFAASSHTHPASDLASGTIATARLGGGVADTTTFLRGDQTYAVPVIQYALNVAAAVQATATDAETIYFGSLAALAPSTTADLSPIYIPKAGTIKAAYVVANAGTAGSNEAWVMHIRKNNTSDTQIASVSLNTANRLWSNTGLSIAVAQGDRIQIKSISPSWGTNPANIRFGGTVYVET